MSENQLPEQEAQQDAEIAIQIEDNIEAQSDQQNSEDELERYTKNVSKRINKLNEKNRQSEQRAQLAEQALLHQDQELQRLRALAQQSEANSLDKEEEAIKAKEMQIDDLYKKAMQANDVDSISKADTLKTELVIQKEKLRIAKQNSQKKTEQAQQVYQQQPVYQQPQQAPEPSEKALSWQDNNPWFDETKPEFNREAHYWARVVDEFLVEEGFVPDSEEYYNELNDRIVKRFPELQASNPENTNVDQSVSSPSMQRVAPASRSRQKTSDPKGGVKFTRDEMERLRPLKPHNMSEEDWFKSVAMEQQKIMQKQA